MKICLISNLYNPYAEGGAEKNVEKLAKALNNDNEIFIITTKPFSNIFSLFPKTEIREGIKTYRFYPLSLFNVYFAQKRRISLFIKILWRIIDLFNVHTFLTVLYILKKERPQIAHTNNLGGFSLSAFWAAKLLNIPVIHTLRDYHLLCPYAGFLSCPFTQFQVCVKRPWPCLIYSLFKKTIICDIPKVIIGPSRFVIDMHTKYGFFNKATLKIIPNFIEKYDDFLADKNNKKTFDVLYVGSLLHQKGVAILTETFTGLKEEFLRLHIVGDGPERKKLQELTKNDSRIIFYGKRRFEQLLRQLYSLCDILVVPSICYENFPTVTLEAFSFGIPVIGSNIGGIPEQIKNGYNGFLFETANIMDLKNKLLLFIDDFKKGGKLLNEMKHKVFESGKDYYRDRIICQLTEIYLKTISEQKC